jgi:hypothetical protein
VAKITRPTHLLTNLSATFSAVQKPRKYHQIEAQYLVYHPSASITAIMRQGFKSVSLSNNPISICNHTTAIVLINSSLVSLLYDSLLRNSE